MSLNHCYFLSPVSILFDLFIHEVDVLVYQEVHSGVESSDLVIESQSEVSAKLRDVPVFYISEGSSHFLPETDQVDAPLATQQLHLGNVALDFSCVEAVESRHDVQLGHWVIHESEALVGVTPHAHVWQLVSHAGTIDVAVDFLVLEHFDYLVAGWVVVAQWLDVVDVVGKDHIRFVLIQFLH